MLEQSSVSPSKHMLKIKWLNTRNTETRAQHLWIHFKCFSIIIDVNSDIDDDDGQQWYNSNLFIP